MPDPPALTKLAELAETDVRSFLNADFSLISKARPRLMVKGAVAAGVWREAVEWDDSEWFPYTGGDHISAPLDRRFGLRVEGESMNQVYPHGTILDCVSTIGGGREIRSGKRVVVVRTRLNGDLEATVKEYYQDPEGREWLLPRSDNPAFQTPVEIGKEEDGVAETVIMATVEGSYRPEA